VLSLNAAMFTLFRAGHGEVRTAMLPDEHAL
jgi:hypothetical protein